MTDSHSTDMDKWCSSSDCTQAEKLLSVPYDEGLIEDLKDSKYAVILLSTILNEKDNGVHDRFLRILKLIAKAHGIIK